jgi:hypothetical protein
MISSTSSEYLVTGLSTYENKKRSATIRRGGWREEGRRRLTLDRGEDGVDTDPSDDAKGPEDVILDEADGHKELVPDLNRQRVKIRVPVKAPPLESGLEVSQGLAMDLREGEGKRMEGGRMTGREKVIRAREREREMVVTV